MTTIEDPVYSKEILDELKKQCEVLESEILYTISVKEFVDIKVKLLKKFFPETYITDSQARTEATYPHLHTVLNILEKELRKQYESTNFVEDNYGILSIGGSNLVLPYADAIQIMGYLKNSESATKAGAYERDKLEVVPFNENYISMGIISKRTYLLAKARAILLGGEN